MSARLRPGAARELHRNAIAGAIQFDREKQSLKPDFVPSRLFIYYNERVIEGTVSQDSGAQIRDGIKSVAQQGVPPESDWPYDITKFAQKPPSKAYSDALLDKAVSYKRVVQTLAQLKSCLASGYPFVFGFTVYESFESDHSSDAPPRDGAARSSVETAAMAEERRGGVIRQAWGINRATGRSPA